jgi:alpha-amylase/alpha-mannosidase (GH57 family)
VSDPASAAAPEGAAGGALDAPAAASTHPVDLLLMWHMHQPDYRDGQTGEFTLPWVYLHALKDYADMAWHLEQNPAVRAVVNFVPVLLDQLEDYAEQLESGRLRDPLLRLLAHDEREALGLQARGHALGQCFRANHTRLIAPFPPYRQLHDLYQSAQAQGADAQRYLADAYFLDLATWYHLSWTGETVRRESDVVAALMAKGSDYTRADRLALLQVVRGVVSQIIPRYRALAERGQVELTSTPHCHPLAPLLLDFASARETLPQAPLPQAEGYPGGRERVRAQLDSALESHRRRFGEPPRGLWPAEGALSAGVVELLAERGLRWTASSEGVLGNSLRAAGVPDVPAHGAGALAHRPYRLPALAPDLLFFFRDDRLSDLIGFVYSKWHGRDAAANFIQELEAIAARAGDGARPLVPVILDGENAWEYYPYNGFYFLGDLYRGLAAHRGIRTVTGSDVVAAFESPPAARDAPAAPGELPLLTAGSWVYGNLATWIGSRDKNRAWDLLCAAKRRYDEVVQAGSFEPALREQAQAQLADCEASDWFWWPGEENPAESVQVFDALFRHKLARLYTLLQTPVPEELGRPFSTGGIGRGEGAEAAGTMRRGSGG